MKKSELLKLQTSVDSQVRENSSSIGINYDESDVKDEDMSKYEILDNAPFVLVDGNDGWFIVMGEHIVSEKRFDSKEAAKRYVDSKPWELIFVGASAYNMILKKLDDNNNNFKDLNDEQES